MMQLRDKTILITGASSGIGEALAYALAREGACLILAARRLPELEAVRARCEAPNNHRCVSLDLATAAQNTEQINEWIHALGPVDILINNAGLGQRATVLETDLSVHRHIMEVNYFALVALTRAVLPGMLQRGEGMVVSIASVMGKMSTPRRSAYAASKHAVVAFMDALRAELHGRGVHCLTVCPGYIRTPFPMAALKGDGAAQGRMDPGQSNGMAPELCASAIVIAMQREDAEVLVGGKETLGVYVKALCPPLYRYLIRKVTIT